MATFSSRISGCWRQSCSEGTGRGPTHYKKEVTMRCSRFKVRASFMFTGCCWCSRWLLMVVRGHRARSTLAKFSVWSGVVERPSANQAGHIPSWRGSCERYALSPGAAARRWSLPCHEAVTVAVDSAQAIDKATGPCTLQGMARVRPGRLRPAPRFLSGVSVEAPGSSVTSYV